MKIFNILLLTFLLSSCGGISMLATRDSGDLYTSDFIKKIDLVKRFYSTGESQQALETLTKINEDTILPTELSLKLNLTGVILFSNKEFEEAASYFNQALLTSRLDISLTSQIYLNLASVQFKLGDYQLAYNTLERADFNKLKNAESKKFHHLRYKLADQLGNDRVALTSLVYYLNNHKNMNSLKNDPYFSLLGDLFNSLESREKIRFFEEMDEEKSFSLGYLAYVEGERLYYDGKKEEGKDLLEWAKDRYDIYPEINAMIVSFLDRLENFSKLVPHAIGVVLPLSGDKKGFGRRALLGLDLAISEINKTSKVKFKLYIKDSEGSGVAGAYRVKELVEKYSVAAVIGGLFSKEAEKEYSEAKKNGVPFISLAQVFLSKEKKNHLLLEMPGSVESLVSKLFSKDMLELFGKKAAIIFPETNRGRAYVDEFWRKAQVHDVVVTGIIPYGKGKTDYRKPIKNLLGLSYPRQRKEELEILEEIYSLEKKSSIRRIQKLKPIIDFDWVFIPSYPKEAVQILPSFSYFDAYKLNIIGGPSWRSRSIVEGKNSRRESLFFIGDSVKSKTEEQFVKSFGKKYKVRAGLIELRSYDALKIITGIISEGDFKSRDALDIAIRSKDELRGHSGSWKIQDGVWTKNMSPLKIKRKRVTNIFEAELVN